MSNLEICNNIEYLDINFGSIPHEYCWSGYTKSTREFEDANFQRMQIKGQDFLVCAEDNAVALCDYVSNKLLKQKCIFDTESIYSPGYDIWFLFAWEMLYSYLNELPQWVQNIIEYLISLGIILECENDEQKYYLFVDSDYYLNITFPDDYVSKIEAICQKAVIEFWTDCLNEAEGKLNELLAPECGEWGEKQFELFVENPEYEMSAYCTSTKEYTVGFGIFVPYRKCVFQNEEWIYNGISDAILENSDEFLEVATTVEAQCLEYFIKENVVPNSERDLHEKLHELLKCALGEFNIEYYVEGISCEMEYFANVSKVIYDSIIHHFGIDFKIIDQLSRKDEQ